MGKKRWEQKTLKSSIFKRKGGKGERAVAPPPPPCKKANKGKKWRGERKRGAAFKEVFLRVAAKEGGGRKKRRKVSKVCERTIEGSLPSPL